MKVLILAYGSRGDVQPLLALGVGLRQAGHHVCIAAPQLFAEPIRRQGLEFAALPGDPTLLMGAVSARAASRLRRLAAMVRHFAPIAGMLVDAARLASPDADVVIHSLWTITIGRLVAHERSLPDICASLFPLLSPTAAFPAVPFSSLRLSAYGNQLTHRLIAQLFWQGNRLVWGAARRANPQLPRWDTHIQADMHDPMPILYGFSPTIVPRPLDWAAQAHITGYWFLDAATSWRPHVALSDFLAENAAPLVVGFGSMVVPPAVFARIYTGLAQTGQPIVWLTGWSNPPKQLPAHMIAIPEAPHDWLYPRATAIVSHGGAGTVGAGLRAGVPMVTVSFLADHLFWGQRVAALGVGPLPLRVTQLTSERLAQAVFAAIGDRPHQHAAQVGAALRAEAGISRAIELIEQATV